jgi:hypothetical protein
MTLNRASSRKMLVLKISIRERLIVNKDVVTHHCAQLPLRDCMAPALITHQHGVIADDVRVTTPEGRSAGPLPRAVIRGRVLHNSHHKGCIVPLRKCHG